MCKLYCAISCRGNIKFIHSFVHSSIHSSKKIQDSNQDEKHPHSSIYLPRHLHPPSLTHPPSFSKPRRHLLCSVLFCLLSSQAPSNRTIPISPSIPLQQYRTPSTKYPRNTYPSITPAACSPSPAQPLMWTWYTNRGNPTPHRATLIVTWLR